MLKQEVKTNIPEETFVALPNRAPVGYDLEVRDGQSLPTSARIITADFWLGAQLVLGEPAGAVDLT